MTPRTQVSMDGKKSKHEYTVKSSTESYKVDLHTEINFNLMQCLI